MINVTMDIDAAPESGDLSQATSRDSGRKESSRALKREHTTEVVPFPKPRSNQAPKGSLITQLFGMPEGMPGYEPLLTALMRRAGSFEKSLRCHIP
jgi:hypothetical protein